MNKCVMCVIYAAFTLPSDYFFLPAFHIVVHSAHNSVCGWIQLTSDKIIG